MDLLDYIDALGQWILSNLDKLVLSAVTFVVVYVIYRIIVREIRGLRAREKLEEHLTYTLIRIAKWVSAFVIISAILAAWGVTLGVISGILALFGGTIVGFAAINTIGNAIAGLIVMTSKPFEVGDLIESQGHLGSVKEIHIFVTILLTPEKKTVILPNAVVSNGNIVNYTWRYNYIFYNFI